MNEQTFPTIDSILAGITTQSTTGNFAYTPDQMQGIIAGFLDLAASYRASIRNSDALARIEAPGLEYVSESHASAARAMGDDYRRSIEDSWRYCLAQAQKFQDTLDDYLGLEHHNVALFNHAVPPEGQAGPQIGI